MTRAALYARVSTDEQVEHGYSLGGQERKVREFAASEGWRVVEVIKDDGYSGADPYRPGLRRVKELAENGEIDVVVAARRDRLFRDRYYRLAFERDLKEYGVRLVALNDTGHKIGDGVLDDFAEWEREEIAGRLHGGIRDMIVGGEIKAGPKPPYGYRFDDTGKMLVVHEPEMAVLRRIFQEMAAGASAGSMIRDLDADGILGPSGLPRWNKKAIAHFLASDLYRPHAAREVAEMVAPEVAANLDPERVFGLWHFNRRETTKRKEWDDMKGKYVTHYKSRERPREEWLAVPVDLTDAGLSASTVDRAREAAKDRYRKPSAAAGRFWQLRGIVCCGQCGSILSPHTVTRKRADGTTARNHYHQCRRHFNTGPRDCDHTTSYPAAALEEAIWQAVHDLISDPERLVRQWEAEVERKRRELLRGDPDREAHHLAEQLRQLEHRRSGYYDLAADGDMSREDLRVKLAEVDRQRHELQKTLRDAQGRRRSIAEAKRQWKLNEGLLQLVSIHYYCAGPEDRRRIYHALRLRADVDREGAIRLAGIIDPDVYLPTLVQGLPLDPSEPVPEGVERHRVVVASGSSDLRR
jgi:site-specific DNA recombinase